MPDFVGAVILIIIFVVGMRWAFERAFEAAEKKAQEEQNHNHKNSET